MQQAYLLILEDFKSFGCGNFNVFLGRFGDVLGGILFK
jgi:hypothetical protein